MKIGIFVCVLVVLACHEALGYVARDSPVLLSGNCRLQDLPVDVRSECGSVTCNRDRYGQISWSRQLCAWTRCGPGQETRKRPSDLTKTYPDCCPRYTCY